MQQRPAYLVVADELRQQILAGRYAPGARLPTMEELRRAYGVSEIVIRHAVSLLRLEGLVETRRGGGTVVRARPQVRRRAMERYAADARQAAEQYAGRRRPGRRSPHVVYRRPRHRMAGIPADGPLLRGPGGRGTGGALRRRTGNGPAAQAFRVLRPRGAGADQHQLHAAGPRGGYPRGRPRTRAVARRDLRPAGLSRPSRVTGRGVGQRPDASGIGSADAADGAGSAGFRHPPAPHIRRRGAGGVPGHRDPRGPRRPRVRNRCQHAGGAARFS